MLFRAVAAQETRKLRREVTFSPVIKCVSKVLGHLSKPAAPTSVPGLLRHILGAISRTLSWMSSAVKSEVDSPNGPLS